MRALLPPKEAPSDVRGRSSLRRVLRRSRVLLPIALVVVSWALSVEGKDRTRGFGHALMRPPSTAPLSQANASGPSQPTLLTACDACQVDTCLVFGPKRYKKTGTTPIEFEDGFTTTLQPGRRYLVEVVNGTTSPTKGSVYINGQEWIGERELVAGVPRVIRRFVAASSNAFTVTLYGGSNAYVYLRIVYVKDPTYRVFGPKTYVKGGDAVDTFAVATSAKPPNWIYAINGAPGGTDRLTSGHVKVNGTEIIQSTDLGSGIATITRNLTLAQSNEVVVTNGSAAGTKITLEFWATDSLAPALAVSPPDSFVTTQTSVTVSGTVLDSTYVDLEVDGVATTVTSGHTFSRSVNLTADGTKSIEVKAEDAACLTSTVTRKVIRDTQNPVLTLLHPAVDTTFSYADSIRTLWVKWIDTTATVVKVDGQQIGKAISHTVAWPYPLDIGPNRIHVRATDAAGHTTELTRLVYRTPPSGGAIPAVNPPTLSSAGTTAFYESVKFLFENTDSLQKGLSSPNPLIPDKAAVVRGKVLARDFGPLSNVTVRVLGHPEYGYTVTRSDGWFDMVVNGGSQLTLRFLKPGFLEAQRSVEPRWNDFAIVDSLALIGRTARVDTVDSDAAKVIRARFASDASGDRQLLLFFDAGTTAKITVNGTTHSFPKYHVRATEYTVGGDGPEAMPAILPPGSAYSYCFQLSLDQGDSLSNASGLVPKEEFTKPVACYVRGLLSFPVGAHIPLGYYDRSVGKWMGGQDVLAIKYLGVGGDSVRIDATGDGVAEWMSALDALGMDATERGQLAASFTAGDTLWRMEVTHFSAPDANPNAAPVGATAPANVLASAQLGIFHDTCERPGSIIECESRVLGERVPVVGTPYTLNYRSSRAPGDSTMRTLHIPLAGGPVPPGVQKVVVIVDVAGQRIRQDIPGSPSTGQFTTVFWNGQDAYGRTVMGSVSATVTVGYEYPSVVSAGSGQLGNSASSTGSALGAGGDRAVGRMAWSRQVVSLGAPSMASAGLGGWTLSPHHFYDRTGRGTLYYGDGSQDAGGQDLRLWTAAGISAADGDRQNGYPAGSFRMRPRDVALGPDGNLYIADGEGTIDRLTPAGDSVYVVAGKFSEKGAYTGDGPATERALPEIWGVALGADSSIYFTISDQVNNSCRVLRVKNGLLTTVAGTSACGEGGIYEGVAKEITIGGLSAIAVGPDGSVFIGTTWPGPGLIVRRIWPDGYMTRYAGGGSSSGPEALRVHFGGIGDLAVDASGNLYVTDNGGDNDVWMISAAGDTTLLVDETPTPQATFNVAGLAVGPDGSLWLTATQGRLCRLDPDGTRTIVAGTGTGASVEAPQGIPALTAALATSYGLAVDRNGSVFVCELGYGPGGTKGIVRRIGPTIVAALDGELMIPSRDGSEAYYFAEDGRHHRTVDPLTGAVLYRFVYDSGNRLQAIYDVNGDSTLIVRSGGVPTKIKGPYGQETLLSLTGGYLSQVSNPAGEAYGFTMSSDPGKAGLIIETEDPREHKHSYTYVGGRLATDQDPGLATQTLQTYADSGRVRKVSLRSHLNRVRQYETRDLLDGTRQRRITGPDNHRWVLSDSIDARQFTLAPDGTTTIDSLVPDPRSQFGMQAPYVARTRVRLPSEMTRVMESRRSVAPSDFAPPTINGTWTSFDSLNGAPPLITKYDTTPTTDMLTITSPEGRITEVAVDNAGRPLSIAVSGLALLAMHYDAHGRPDSLQQGGRGWRYGYDSGGRLAVVRDTLGRMTTFGYDAADRMTAQTFPGGRSVAFDYDLDGNLTSLTPPGRPAHTFAYTPVALNSQYTPPAVMGVSSPETRFEYNPDRQLTKIARAGVDSVRLAYGTTTGRLDTLSQPRGASALTYAASGQLATLSSPDGITLTYGYDGPLVLSEEWSGAMPGDTVLPVSHTYNRDFEDSTETVGASTVTFTHDNDGLLTGAGALTISRSAGNGLVTATAAGNMTSSMDYNHAGELVNLRYAYSGATLFQQSLARDSLGRVTGITEDAFGTSRAWGYRYDMAGRLYGVTLGGDTTATFLHDANGNRTLTRSNYVLGVPTTLTMATFDDQDRMLTHGMATYEYTAAGDLRKKTVLTAETEYEYDALGNLLEVKLSVGDSIAYAIDGANRRVGRKENEAWSGGWLYRNALNVVAELDTGGAIVNRYVYGAEGHVPALMLRGGVTYRLVTDHLGSVRGVVNVASGVVAQRRDYDAWGVAETDSNPTFQALGYGGGLADPTSGLIRFGARDYDPRVGRWTTKDPIGFDGLDTNLYSYVFGLPTVLQDPTGLDVYVGLYPGPAGHGHLGIGLSPSRTYGLNPREQSRWKQLPLLFDQSVPGRILRDDPQTQLHALRIKTTPEQDRVVHEAIKRYHRDPNLRYRLRQHCGDLVLDVLREAGIWVESDSVLPKSMFGDIINRNR